MSPLRTLARDLVERRLWPVAALLVVGLITLPLLFLRPSPAAIAPAPAPASAAAPAAPAGAATTTSSTPGDASADPGVALTSSPFAAAFGAGLSLPPSMEGLLKQTKGADDRKAVADAPLRDPFASTASASTSTASPSASTAAAPAPSTPAPAATGGSPAAAPAPSAQPAAAPASAPEPAPSPAPSQSEPAAAAASTTIYHADVRFGTAATNPMVSDAKRLTAFPSSLEPVAVYLGVMRGGWGAAFALREGSQPTGAPSCRPRKQICSWVILHPGEEVTLNVKDAVTGAVTAYRLKVDKIRATTVTPKAATTAAKRVDTAGRCLLGPLAAYRYDTKSGTLAPRPELKGCRYRAPGQAQTASVRLAHIG